MTDETKAITPQEALVREAEVLERLAVVYRCIAVAGGATEPKGHKVSGHPAADVPLTRLSIEDAVVSILRSAQVPQKSSQVCSALLAADYQFISEDPIHATHGAIKRLSMRANPDVVYVAGGKWTLASNHTPAKLQKFKEKLSGRGGRSSEEHGKRTKEGMLARNARFGRYPKFGPDDIAKFRRLVEHEKMRPLKALEEAGISTAYYYAYKDAIYAWKPGDSWPPAGGFPRKDGDGSVVVPLHGRTTTDKAG